MSFFCLLINVIFVTSTYKLTEAVARRCSVKKVFCEKGVLKPFAKFTGKHLCERCFPVYFAEFFRTPFFKEYTPPVAASKLKKL